jgi:hypothetical protein
LLARLAAFRFIFQTLIVKKDLLSSGPDEILAAINAFNCAIGVLAVGTRSRFVGEFGL